MILKIFNIRRLQIKRSLEELTVFHLIALIWLIVFMVVLPLLQMGFKDNNALIVTGLGIFGISFLHLNRPDKNLISIISEKPFKIFNAEYLVLLIPIIGILIYTRNIVLGIGILGLVLGISLIQKRLSAHKGTAIFSKYLPKSAFEWRAGMRKKGLLVVAFYLLALGFSWVRILPFLLLFFALVVIASFFYSCEPLSILCLSDKTARQFLWCKIIQSLKIYTVITIPVIGVALFFSSDIWYVGVLFYVLACLNILSFILAKYAFFQPQSSIGGGSVLSSLCLLGCVIPFLAPLPLIMPLVYYFKAHKKLAYYLRNGETISY